MVLRPLHWWRLAGEIEVPVKEIFLGMLGLFAGRGLKPFSGELNFRRVEGIDEPFAPLYERDIRPKVQVFESQRVAAVRSLALRLFVSSVVLIGAIATIIYTDGLNQKGVISDDTQGIIIWIGIGIMLFLFWWTFRPVSKYKSSVKSEIYPLIFKYFGKDFTYKEEGPLSARSVKDSGIIPNFEDEAREDYVRGTWKGVRLELTETKLTVEHGSGEDSRTETKFRGLLILLTMNKKFSGRTVIKRDLTMVFNWFADKFERELENVKLEDPRFEREFEVYSSDQVEARYLLTPTFMERLMELTEAFGGKPIQACFFKNKLLLTIKTNKDRFETGSIFRPATFAKEIDTVLKEMPAIFKIVEVLKLDQKIGL